MRSTSRLRAIGSRRTCARGTTVLAICFSPHSPQHAAPVAHERRRRVPWQSPAEGAHRVSEALRYASLVHEETAWPEYTRHLAQRRSPPVQRVAHVIAGPEIDDEVEPPHLEGDVAHV